MGAVIVGTVDAAALYSGRQTDRPRQTQSVDHGDELHRQPNDTAARGAPAPTQARVLRRRLRARNSVGTKSRSLEKVIVAKHLISRRLPSCGGAVHGALCLRNISVAFQ